MFLCVWRWVGEKKICTAGFCWSKYLTFKGLSRGMGGGGGDVLQGGGNSYNFIIFEIVKKVSP